MKTTHLYTQFVATLPAALLPLVSVCFVRRSYEAFEEDEETYEEGKLEMLNSQLVSRPNPEEGLLDLRTWGKPLSSGLIERI